MKTSAEEILNNIELYYENVYNLLKGFQQATTTNLSSVIVPIKNKNGVSFIWVESIVDRTSYYDTRTSRLIF